MVITTITTRTITRTRTAPMTRPQPPPRITRTTRKRKRTIRIINTTPTRTFYAFKARYIIILEINGIWRLSHGIVLNIKPLSKVLFVPPCWIKYYMTFNPMEHDSWDTRILVPVNFGSSANEKAQVTCLLLLLLLGCNWIRPRYDPK
jgi:hypothetical protein